MFQERLNKNPMIAAVKEIKLLDVALHSPAEVLFLLSGDIFSIGEVVAKAHEHDKMIFIHIDLIDGFSRDAVALRYINENICPDGIISTRAGQIRIAKELGLLTIQRFFIMDSLSFGNAIKASLSVKSDAIEIMPGVMPKTIERMKKQIRVPLIAGGLICEKEDIIAALRAGADAVSSTDRKMWSL